MVAVPVEWSSTLVIIMNMKNKLKYGLTFLLYPVYAVLNTDGVS